MRYLPLHKGEEDSIFEQSVREFCEKEVKKDISVKEQIRKMGEVGLTGALIPTAYGGAGYSMRQYIVLMECLACYGGGSIALTLIAHHSLSAAHIVYAGTEEQKRTFLPKLASGEMIGAWCLTEPNAGSDAFGGMQTTADRNGAGWMINGSKRFITDGLNADIYIVIAKIRTDVPAKQEYGVFIIPNKKIGIDEIQRLPVTNKIGMHASDTAELSFESVKVGVSSKMEGEGRMSTYKVLNNSRIGISAIACGLSRSALSEAIDYAKERKTFGQPIATRQGVSFPLADAYSELRACWAMVKEAALAADNGELSSTFSSAVKLKTTESALKGCMAAMDVFGGSGYLNDTRATRDWLDARLLQVGEGTSNMQRLTITRGLFSEGFSKL